MKIGKKFLALVLAMLVLMASMPALAVAAEGETMEENGIHYTVDGTSATIVDYTGSSTELVIPSELGGAVVTKIGDDAFRDAESLTAVVLPEALEVICEQAFYGCTGLTAVVIPDTVTSIDYEAFRGCTSLKDVKLSKNLEYLGSCAFQNAAIAEIEIPKSLDKAATSTFSSSYTFNDVEYGVAGGPFFACDNLKTVKFEKGTTAVAEKLFSGATGLEEITIPETVTTIEVNAFEDCLRLSKVNMSDYVTAINGRAFESCISLKSIDLSDGLTTLGNRAFAYTALESIDIPRSLDSASKEVFSDSYTFNDETYSVERGPFVGCENLKTVTFQKGTNQIAENLFAGAVSLEEITIPDTVTTIEESAFMDCLRLSKVTMPDTVTRIDLSAFESCISLKNIDLSDSLKSMGSRAFGYTALESVVIPKSMDFASIQVFNDAYEFNGESFGVDRGPFVLCENLKTVTFEDGIKAIPESILAGAVAVEKIVIPEGAEAIEKGAFQGCIRLTDITFPTTVATIGEEAFSNCVSIDALVIPESVTAVGEYAFGNMISLKSIEFTNPDTTLDEEALADCRALTDVKLPANLKELKEEVFAKCTSLKTVDLPESLGKIGRAAFAYCATLDEAVIPEGVAAIGSDAFMDCKSLKKVNVPQSVKELGDGAFYGCESLTDVAFADYSITELEKETFKDCFAIKEIKLPKGLNSIGAEAFVNDFELTDVYIPESVEEIAENAFSYPGKTTIYSQSGSYVEEYANNGGFNFVDNIVEAESISLAGGVDKIVIEGGESVRLQFEMNPADANETIKLTRDDDWYLKINGMDITSNGWSTNTVITATTSSGASCTFEFIVRTLDYITVEELPVKTAYLVGEELDLSGMVVNAVYSDETTEEITGYTVSGFDSSTPGEYEVTVNWTSPKGKDYDTDLDIVIAETIEEIPVESQFDEETFVSVDTFLNADLKVEVITEEETINRVSALSKEEVSMVYGITLNKGDKTVDMNGKATVKVPAESESAKVYGVDKAGTITEIQATYEDGYMTFAAEEFTVYAVTLGVSYENGDVNMDGKLNIKDATTIQKFAAKMIELDETALKLADFNGDEKVNVKDATTIQKKIAGLIL